MHIKPKTFDNFLCTTFLPVNVEDTNSRTAFFFPACTAASGCPRRMFAMTSSWLVLPVVLLEVMSGITLCGFRLCFGTGLCRCALWTFNIHAKTKVKNIV